MLKNSLFENGGTISVLFSRVNYVGLVKFLGNLSAFLFFSLFLSTGFGHSIAIVIALVFSVLSIPLWGKEKLSKELKITILFFIFLAIYWSHTFDALFSISLKGDQFLRYSLGILFIIAFSRVGIHPRSIVWGMSLGVITAGVLAVYQYNAMGRAEGYTNAVRFGNIALLMFLVCFAASFTSFFSKKERVLFCVSSVFGLIASILSLSRGGWLILIAIPFLIFFIFNKHKKIASVLILGSLISIIFFASLPPVAERIKLAGQEVSGYFNDKNQFIHTSVGVRLEQWKTAFLMGMEKPLTGWGDENIKNGKLEYIARGISDESIMNYNHAHNDFFETWARQGIVGVVSLIFVYIAPVYLMFSEAKKISTSTKLNHLKRFLVLSGVIICLGYLIFGFTSVFFKFVIGHNFYLFSFVFIFSAMCWVKNQSIE